MNINIDKEIDKPKTTNIKEVEILKLLSSAKITEDKFPVKELYYKVNLNFKMPINIVYKLIINNFDKYKLFGIEQILQLNRIQYSIIKTNNNMKLFINFHTKRNADEIISLMKRYNIDIELKKIFIKG